MTDKQEKSSFCSSSILPPRPGRPPFGDGEGGAVPHSTRRLLESDKREERMTGERQLDMDRGAGALFDCELERYSPSALWGSGAKRGCSIVEEDDRAEKLQ